MTSSTHESEVPPTSGKRRLEVSFNLYGSPIGPNKSKSLTRSLALAKSIVGLKYDDWRLVPRPLKKDLWNSLILDFDIPSMYMDNIISLAEGQLKTWKKNLRTRIFGKDASVAEILAWKDRFPSGESIPMPNGTYSFNVRLNRRRLKQRAKNKANRAKKTDVHLLGAKSYAQVSSEWTERTVGTEEEGTEPSRANLFIHSRRKRKTGELHQSFVETAAKIIEIQSTQTEVDEDDVDNDALSRHFGKEKKGRTRGIGKISSAKVKAVRPAVSEIQKMMCQMEQQNTKIDTILDILQSRQAQDCPSPSTSQSGVAKKSSVAARSSSGNNVNVPIKARGGYYHIRDLKDEKNVAMAKIESVEPGTLVHTRPLKCPEVKLNVLSVDPNMENEPVYLDRQGGNTTIGEFEGSYIAWPVYLLKEMMP